MPRTKSRQSFLGAASEGELSRLRVGVIGLGGGGSHVVQQLAHVGIGQFVLCDPDRIETSNLNRLVGATREDVRARRHKTAIAIRLIRGVKPRARICELREHWQLVAAELRACDVILGCVDSFRGRAELEAFARRYLIPYIDIGMDVVSEGASFRIVGQVMLSLPQQPCLRCVGIVSDHRIADEEQRYGAAGARPQVVWSNGVLASLAVGVAVQLRTPWAENQESWGLWEFDGNANVIAPSSVMSVVSPHCEHYVQHDSVGDPWWSM